MSSYRFKYNKSDIEYSPLSRRRSRVQGQCEPGGGDQSPSVNSSEWSVQEWRRDRELRDKRDMWQAQEYHTQVTTTSHLT